MHPGAWFAWAACAGIAGAMTTNPFYLVPLGLVAWAVHSLRRIEGPQTKAFKVFALFGLITIATRTSLVLFERVTLEATSTAFLEGLRLAVLLAIFGTFNSVADPFRVLRLAPRRFQEPALAAALALSITPRTLDAVARVREAQRLRGMDVKKWRSWPALAVPVLATGMDDAVVLAESMDARGHGRGPRSSYRPECWSRAASVTTVVSLIALTVFVARSATGTGALVVYTYPVRMPEADALLMAATLAFAVPALLPGAREHVPARRPHSPVRMEA